MNSQEQMWYTYEEVLVYLNVNEDVLKTKIHILNIQPRNLPGKSGLFYAKRDVLLIKEYILHPGIIG